MAAGVGPSSTVARQTPVRKHVAGDSDALIRATARIPDGFFLSSSTAKSFKEFGLLIRHPSYRHALSRSLPRRLTLSVTIVGAGDSKDTIKFSFS